MGLYHMDSLAIFTVHCNAAVVQLTKALQEDEFAVEHRLAYRLDQVISAMASSVHDTPVSVFA